MIMYHGSDIIVDKPDVKHSTRRLDFGEDLELENAGKKIIFSEDCPVGKLAASQHRAPRRRVVVAPTRYG